MQCCSARSKKGNNQASDGECIGRTSVRARQDDQFATALAEVQVAQLDLQNQLATLQSGQKVGDVEQPKAHETASDCRNFMVHCSRQMQQFCFELDQMFSRLAQMEIKLTGMDNSMGHEMPTRLEQMEKKLIDMGDHVAHDIVTRVERVETRLACLGDSLEPRSSQDIDLKIPDMISTPKQEIKYEASAADPDKDLLQEKSTEDSLSKQKRAAWQLPPQNNLVSEPAELPQEVAHQLSEKSEGNETYYSSEGRHTRVSMWSDSQEPFRPEYSFRESVWDLAVFTSFTEIGAFGTLLTIILCIFNIVLQLSFCIVVYLNFTGNNYDLDAVAGLRTFRHRTAHDAQYADSLSGYTLIQGICNEGKSFNWRQNRFHVGSGQLDILNTVDSYLSDDADGLQTIFNGKLMCVLALVCWCLTGLEEIRSIHNFFCAILAIPLSDRTKLHRTTLTFTWGTISHARFSLCAFIAILRIACCCFVIYCGCVWLSYTDDAGSLLLNAVALSFVINVDELLFEALAPLPCKKLIDVASPIEQIHWINYKGVDIFSLSVLIIFPTLTAIFTVFWVEAMIDDMMHARSVLCDGDRTFSYSTDTMGVIWYQRWTSKITHPFLSVMDHAASKSVQQLINTETPYLGNPTVAGASDPLQIAQKSFSDLVSFANRGCRDILDYDILDYANHPTWGYHNFLQEFVKSTDLDAEAGKDCASACAAIETLPTFKEGRYVRFVCSESCGCRRPDATIPSNSAYYGCTTNCLYTREYREKLYSMRCTDPSVTDLKQSDFWHKWITFMNYTFGKYGNPRASLWAMDMELYGCGFLKNVTHSTRLTLCEGTEPFVNMRPFAPICPDMCECRLKSGFACNPYCANTTVIRRRV